MAHTIKDQAEQRKCDGCNAEAGEGCRPTCTGRAVLTEDDRSSAGIFGGNVISSYSRADALADGVLVAVPEALARDAGFIWPVALTSAAWADCVAWPADLNCATLRGAGQDETGRLWDVLWMARAAVRQAGPGGTRLDFSLLRVPPTEGTATARTITVSLLAGPGDRGKPVIAICEPGED